MIGAMFPKAVFLHMTIGRVESQLAQTFVPTLRCDEIRIFSTSASSVGTDAYFPKTVAKNSFSSTFQAAQSTNK